MVDGAVEGTAGAFPRSTALKGAAGVYFVASRLAFEEFHAAITLGNAPGVDVLVSNRDGTATVALQVKTTEFAVRERGRGDERKPDHYEWDVGYKSAHVPARRDLLFAFVDLKRFKGLPDIFVVPSAWVANWCAETESDFRAQGKEWKRYRLHIAVEEFAAFKNNLDPLRQLLGMPPPVPTTRRGT